MWNWFNCYLSGRHDFSAWCEPGAIFLRCIHCGKRTTGWEVHAKPHAHPQPPTATVVTTPAPKARVVQFQRAAAR
jgi:hypothetical protein